jgi:hypothetical protein
MAHTNLGTYLNDHLAGSTAALELLEHLTQQHAGSGIATLASGLHGEISADRKVLEDLIARIEVSESAARKATSWVMEKFARLKLRMDDPSGGAFYLLEAFEALSLGIEGKASLWRTLLVVSAEVTALRGPDYSQLLERAEAQRDRIEPVKLDMARKAFAG